MPSTVKETLPAKLNQNLPEFRNQLLGWYDREHRKLPWRVEKSTYRTVVSELMCQQTQIATVLPYFDRWMRELPDFEALAAAPEAQVLKLWEGLGYYSRARNLQKLAKALVEMDAYPTDAKGWQRLPGIGPYTAAAIASIHNEQPIAVVDGNVIRVITRLTADERPFKDGPSAAKLLQDTANQLQESARPGDYNQATMELGALICTKHNPMCTVCPVVNLCASAAQGTQEAFPKLVPKKVTKVEIPRAWVFDKVNKTLLLAKIPDTAKRLAGHCELPELQKLGANVSPKNLMAKKSRGISNQRIAEPIYTAQPPYDLPQNHFWAKIDALDTVQLTGPHRRWIEELLKKE
ncbi:MAG: A/G-specific adenine glycosylase [Opitutales bacterium]